MIYLDGSRFFFDIEGCFSNLVEQAREQNKNLEADKNAEEICKGFAKFFGTKPEYVRAGKDYSVILKGIFEKASVAVIPEFDVFAKHFEKAFSDAEPVRIKKAPDMKLKAEAIINAVNENGAEAVFLSNPCCPTALEISPADIIKIADAVSAKIIVDESYCVDESISVLKEVPQHDNIVVLKKMRFGGEPVFAAGKDLPDFDCGISSADQAATKIIFEHDSALKTAQRKLIDSRDSLYIRIKKLAIKFDALERLYRSKANCVFFKVKNADERAKNLMNMGISVRSKDGYFCVFAGEKDENEAVLKALETVLK